MSGIPGMVPILRRLKRPGARMQFISVPRPTMRIGERGVVCAMLELPWGSESDLIEVSAMDFIRGGSERYIGFSALTDESMDISLLFNGATTRLGRHISPHTAKIMRLNIGGTKATATIGELTVTAKYTGTFGNNIIIAVQEDNTEPDEAQTYTVITALSINAQGEPTNIVDIQSVEVLDDLEDNDYVTFDGTGIPEPLLSKPLDGGTNGKSDYATRWLDFNRALYNDNVWQTVAVTTNNATIMANAVNFIRELRETENRGVQCVLLYGHIKPNFHGAIMSPSSLEILGTDYGNKGLCLWLAGAAAGATGQDDLTNCFIPNVTNYSPKFTSREIEHNLKRGTPPIRTSRVNDIGLEEDINTLHTFTMLRNEEFRDNKVIRVLDTIKEGIFRAWVSKYMGAVPNTETGRELLRADIDSFMQTMQSVGMIQNYRGTQDIEVSQGEELSDVVVNLHIMPVGTMKRLYLTGFVRIQAWDS
ncbi:MAG: hypothetical protein FWG63_03690 [Defluviitaleaceae bacterium]|nr:hypothetical protein [Defluviitaleaceae bacterium]